MSTIQAAGDLTRTTTESVPVPALGSAVVGTIQGRGLLVNLDLTASFPVPASVAVAGSETPIVTAADGKSASATDETGVSAEPSSSGGSRGQVAQTPGGLPVTTIPPQQAAGAFGKADQAQAIEALNALVPERAGTTLSVPSFEQMVQGLVNAASQIRRQGAAPATRSRVGPGGPQSSVRAQRGWHVSDASPIHAPQRDGDWMLADAQALNLISDAGHQAQLLPNFAREDYNPAILHVRFTEDRDRQTSRAYDSFLDITLITSDGQTEGRRVELSRKAFADDLRLLYQQLSRQDPLAVENPQSPSRRLYDQLFAAIAPSLRQKRVTTLLISADRGLQAVPFSALHGGDRFFGDSYAFALTPSLALTSLLPSATKDGRMLAAGSALFDDLAPLPMVPVELSQVSIAQAKDVVLNKAFTPATLLSQAANPVYTYVHVATHAEFLPGGAAASRLYSGTGPVPLADFVGLRRARQSAPLDLISFSACRTALGDSSSEMGFAGLALQAGARSAVGTLWYVDDVVTSAYFVQMYRYLQSGVPKAEALQLTRQSFIRGLIRLSGDDLIAADGSTLLSGLTADQKRRLSNGTANPYFWAGIELMGSAW